MQEQKYSGLEERAIPSGIERLEVRALINQEVEAMKIEGKAFTLTDEEIGLLSSFRRFKLRMRKEVEMFTWQTRKPEEVQIVEETAEIIHPQE